MEPNASSTPPTRRPDSAAPGRLAFLISQFPETHETFILREFLELKRLGFELTIFSLKRCRDRIVHPAAAEFGAHTVYSPFFLSWALIADNIHVLCTRPVKLARSLLRIARRHWSTPTSLLKTIAAVPIALHYGCMMQRGGFTHVHVHWANIPGTLGWLLHKVLGVSFSITAHAFDIFLRNPMLEEKITAAEFVVTCTDYNKRFLKSIGGKRSNVYLNYHGIDLTKIPPPVRHRGEDRGRLSLLSVGRLKEQKGFPYLIEACHRLDRAQVDFECVIVGDGPERRTLERLIDRCGLKRRVRLLGTKTQSEIFDLYRRADIFVLPCVIGQDNDRDGIPNVIIEAYAMCLPVVSTSICAVPEIVRDEETGLLARERSVEDLLEKIRRLADDAALRDRTGSAGRRWIEARFDIRRNVEELGALFRRRLASPTSTGETLGTSEKVHG